MSLAELDRLDHLEVLDVVVLVPYLSLPLLYALCRYLYQFLIETAHWNDVGVQSELRRKFHDFWSYLLDSSLSTASWCLVILLPPLQELRGLHGVSSTVGVTILVGELLTERACRVTHI